MKSITTRKEQKDLALSREARGHGDKLERKAEAAIVALLSHPTIPEAAKAAGVSQTTLWRWLQREDFQGKFREAQNKVFDGALGSLQGASADAVQCLRRNLNCGNPPSEIASARAILDFTMRARELIELTERVSSLEGVLSRLQR